MKKALILTALLVASFSFAEAAPRSEIHIDRDGNVVAKNITLYQRSNTILFTRVTWGNVFVRMTVLTNDKTSIVKNHGEKASVSDLKEGDILDIEGIIPSSSEGLIVSATSIRNVSLEKESKTVSGTIKTLNKDTRTLTLTDKNLGTITISFPSGSVKKGARTIPFSDISVGEKILSAPGTYDYPTNTLVATSLEVYQDKSIFVPRNFEGTLKSMSGSALPVTLVVTISGTDYSVYLNEKTVVLNNKKEKTTLSRFVVGDTVRFYGVRRLTNLQEVDAEVVRDTNF